MIENMIQVKGYLGDLLRELPTSIDIDYKSLEKCPLVRDGKAVGFVEKVDLDTKIWYGYMYQPLVSFTFNDEDKKHYFSSLMFL